MARPPLTPVQMARFRALDELGDLPLDELLSKTAPFPVPADDDEYTETFSWFYVLHHERMAAFDRESKAWPGPREGPAWEAFVDDYEARAHAQNAFLLDAMRVRGHLDDEPSNEPRGGGSWAFEP